MQDKRSIAILIFDDVEVLDFAGPYEVFSRTRLVAGLESRRSDDSAPFHVFTVASRPGTIDAVGGLTVTPDTTFANAPPIDILCIPGGFGTRALLEDEAVLGWIRKTAARCELVTSVCTGALLLAKAGLLRGAGATTHWSSLATLARLDGTVDVQADVRWVDAGRVVTSAGVAAGIDMAFHLVERLCGREVADETARYIEFPRARACASSNAEPD